MKYQHYQKVLCTIAGTPITDARISIDSGGIPFICQNEINGINAENKLGYKYSYRINKDFTYPDVKNLRPFERTTITWDTLEQGDFIEDKDGEKREILHIGGRAIFPSKWDNFNKGCTQFYTKEEFIHLGYTIIQPHTEIREVTQAEVDEKFGEEVRVK